MNSRERIKRAFSHREADRPPMDFGGTIVTSLTRSAYIKLLNYLNNDYDTKKIEIVDYTMGTVIPDEKILKKLNVDFRRIGINSIPQIINNKFRNAFGTEFKKAEPHDYYDMVRFPLKELDQQQIKKIPWPHLKDKSIFNKLSFTAKDMYENTKYGLVGCMGPSNFFEMGQELRGFDQFGIDLLLNKEIVKTIFDNLLEIQIDYYDLYLKSIGKYIDVIFYADDLGMQDRMQLSPKLYREMVKPYHKKIFDFIKNRTDAKIFLHCCGSIYPVIGDLIEVGVDILNPVQTTAKDMEPEKLKKEFGEKIVFWGAIDEQYLLNKASKKEIKENVLKTIKIMGKNGGYVAAATHNIQDDTPCENILFLFNLIENLKVKEKLKLNHN